MTQMVLNISDVSLVPSLKQILEAIKGITIDRLISNPDVESEQRFISDTITQGYREAQEGRFEGRNLSSLDDLIEELKSEAV